MKLNEFESQLNAIGTFTSALYPDKNYHLVLDKSGHRRFVISIVDQNNERVDFGSYPLALIHKFDIGRFTVSSRAHNFFDDFDIYVRILRLVAKFSLTDPMSRDDYTVSKWEITNTKRERTEERQRLVQQYQQAAQDDDDNCDCDDEDDDYDDDDYDF